MTQEYIITEEKINAILNFLIGDDYRFVHKILSSCRPYTNECDPGMGVDDFVSLAGKMEVSIRKDEREKVLNEFLRILSKEEFPCMESPYTVIERIHKIIEQLRNQGEPK